MLHDKAVRSVIAQSINLIVDFLTAIVFWNLLIVPPGASNFG
jgi:hypothetical protein